MDWKNKGKNGHLLLIILKINKLSDLYNRFIFFIAYYFQNTQKDRKHRHLVKTILLFCPLRKLWLFLQTCN